jgi:hypothetical protein
MHHGRRPQFHLESNCWNQASNLLERCEMHALLDLNEILQRPAIRSL